MAWWSKVKNVIEKHDAKLNAAIRLNFAHNMGGTPYVELGLYKPRRRLTER